MPYRRMNPALRVKLIEEVQKYPILYDLKHEGHRDSEMRDRAWMEISERLAENTEILKREWKILRDSLRQALRNQQGLKKNGEPCKKWTFESKMAFLKPYMTKRPAYQYGDENGTDSKLETDTSEPIEQDMDTSEVEQPTYYEPDDGLELFFASVCQASRRLSRRLQHQLKRQVLEALIKAEEEHDSTESKQDIVKF